MRGATKAGCIAVLALWLVAAHTAAGQSYEWRPGEAYPGVSGVVETFANWDPDGAGPEPERLVIGGAYFVAGGVLGNRIAAWDGTRWEGFGSGMDNTVYAIASYNGHLYAGGSFRNAGGTNCNYVARWDGSAWQPLGTGGLNGASDAVYAMTVYNDQLILAGSFVATQGVPRYAIVGWDGSNWHNLGSGINGTVRALAVFDGELIAAGSFTSAGGVSCSNIARWNGTTWQPLGSGTNGAVQDLTVYNGELIAGGSFTTAGGISNRYIARWDGTSWQSLGGMSSGSAVNALAVYDGQLVAGGTFLFAGGVPCRYIARWDGTTWSPLADWQVVGGTDVRALAVFQGELIAGGNFASAGGVTSPNAARWDGTAWRPLVTGMNGNVRAVFVYNDQLVAGGQFTTAAGGLVCNSIARREGSIWQPLGSGTNGTVYALAEYNGELIAAGSFTTAGGVTCNNIARWDGTGWQPLATGLNGVVYALTVYNGQLIAGGAFSATSGVGGTPCSRIAAWDGSTWSPLGSGMDGIVRALTVYGDRLIAGGSFFTAGGITCGAIASWDGTTWADLAGGVSKPNPYAPTVYGMAVYHDQLIVGGDFSAAGGVPACYSVARWDGEAWSPMDQTNGVVAAVCIYNDEIHIAGPFGAASGVPVNAVARWDGSLWQPMAGGLGGECYAMTVHKGELVVGGAFHTTRLGAVSAYWARWGPDVPMVYEHPASQSVVLGQPATFSVAATGSGELSYQWRKDGVPLVDGERITGATTDTLGISALTADDGGLYDCVVSNAIGSTDSTDATLTVLVPAAIVTQPTSQSVQAGQSVSLSVSAVGTEPLSYQWRRSGAALSDDSRISGSTTHTLTIDPVEAADGATYDVVVSNDYGTETSTAVEITILPTILVQPAAQAVIAGQPLSLSVSAVGSGTLTWQWRKDGVALVDDGRILGSATSSLLIDPSGAADAGSYDVVVTSEYGTISSDVVSVTILLPPAIVTQPASQDVLAGSPLRLSVVATGSGTLAYQWRKDGAALVDDGRILGSTTSSLTIQPSQTSDAGIYDVVVTSEYGTATSDAAAVTVTVPVVITQQPNSPTVRVGDPATISVEATGPGTLTWQWRKDGVVLLDGGTITGATTSTLAISSVSLDDAGSYDVVITCAGTSVTSQAGVLSILNAEPTPVGTQVSLPLVDPNTGFASVTVIFENVTSPGITAVTTVPPSDKHKVPVGFKLGQPPVLYQLETTAEFTGTIEVCFDYGNISYGNESKLRLFHFDNDAWVDITTSLDTVNDRIYGTVSHFSVFGVMEEVNTAPAVTITFPVTGHIQAINTDLTLTATISDPDVGDTHTAVWTIHDDYWGDQLIPGAVNGTSVQNVVQFAAAGIYHISLTVTDADGETATASVVNDDPTLPAFVVIYDPTGGHVTGGGWITSPAGALQWTPEGAPLNTEGKATFGFTAKYHKGAAVPKGNTEFQLHAGDLRFKSTEYQWLVVAGNKAKFKGFGEIRDLPGLYAFQLTGVADSRGDRFRIKIWDEATGHVIYDNKRGQDDDADPTLLGGGSIKVHK